MSSADAGGRRAAVLGSPISHSLSPVLHRAAYAALGLDGWTYDAVECDEATLPGFVADLGPEWAGLSVTMPGKAAAAAAADHRSPAVELLGVANTLYRQEDRPGWSAANTDVQGIVGALTAVHCRPARAMLLGGGGTAMAAVAALAELGTTDLILVGRSPRSTAAAGALAEHLGMNVQHLPWQVEPVTAATVDLAFSSVPAGVADPLAEALADVPVLFDAIYHPWPTPVAAAGATDRRTVTGLDMLLHQALAQVELMTGRPAPAAQMRSALLAATGLDLPLRLLPG